MLHWNLSPSVRKHQDGQMWKSTVIQWFLVFILVFFSITSLAPKLNLSIMWLSFHFCRQAPIGDDNYLLLAARARMEGAYPRGSGDAAPPRTPSDSFPRSSSEAGYPTPPPRPSADGVYTILKCHDPVYSRPSLPQFRASWFKQIMCCFFRDLARPRWPRCKEYGGDSESETSSLFLLTATSVAPSAKKANSRIYATI